MTAAMASLPPDELERLAHRRARAKRVWIIHLMVYVVVNVLVFSMSTYALGNRPWSIFPLLGWGVGLVLHGVSVFLLGEGSSFRERLLEREREHLLRQQERGRRP